MNWKGRRRRHDLQKNDRDKGMGRKEGYRSFTLARMTLQATIEGERWTHNGRRSRTIIDRRVYAAGHQLTDWLTYLYYGIIEATLYPGHRIQPTRRRRGRDAHAVDLHRLIWRLTYCPRIPLSMGTNWKRVVLLVLWHGTRDRMWNPVLCSRIYTGFLFTYDSGNEAIGISIVGTFIMTGVWPIR